jgi:serine-type D-Ala-D-Ala carboxypeptidase/endopeptidase
MNKLTNRIKEHQVTAVQSKRGETLKRLFFAFSIMIQLMILTSCGVNPKPSDIDQPPFNTSLKKLDGGSISTSELEAFIEQTMQKANVTGLSVAILNDSQLVYQKSFGYMDRKDGRRNGVQTIFSGASLSKPVFAYLVMLLAEEHVIDLDKPLYEYMDKPFYEYPAYADLKGDERSKQITARMVLSHSTGLPNLRWQELGGRLRFLFPPGERHSYSGEGYMLLQMVIENITGKDLETLAQEKIFQPLGMDRTSYTWQPEFKADLAYPHDEYGRAQGIQIRRRAPSAAGSLATTAGDYACFLVGILNAEGQRKATVDEMLQPQIPINYKQMFGPDAWTTTQKFQNIHLAWGLGWGRFDTPYGSAFFHTGSDPGWKNYTVTYIDQGIGIVMLSNSDNFESIAAEIVEVAIGDVYSPFDWLDYVPFNPANAKTPPPDPTITIGPIWLGLTLASLMLMIVLLLKKPRLMIFWLPVTLVLGPLGLLVWLIAGRPGKAGNGRRILLEGVGDLVPTIVIYMAAAVVIHWISGVEQFTILAVFCIAPALIGWLLFQVPWLALATRKSYYKILPKRMPHTWIAANLGIAAIFFLATPLVNSVAQLGLNLWMVVTWWAFAVLGALAGFFLLGPFELWNVHRGYQAWSLVTVGETDIASAPWRRSWWWILLSFVALFGGVVGYVILTFIQ